ncbi:MAG TPA: hypothetical protein VFP34_08900 [Microlunatus sp.]|nr:hypothetical protein [Microlunatus sp.]
MALSSHCADPSAPSAQLADVSQSDRYPTLPGGVINLLTDALAQAGDRTGRADLIKSMIQDCAMRLPGCNQMNL